MIGFGEIRSFLRHEAAWKRASLVFQAELDTVVTSIGVHSALPQWRPVEIDKTGLEYQGDRNPEDEREKTLPEIRASLEVGTLSLDPKWKTYDEHCREEQDYGIADICYALRHIPESGVERGQVFYTTPTNASLLYAAEAARPATSDEHTRQLESEQFGGKRREGRCPSSLRRTLARLSFALRCSRGNGDRVRI